MRARLKKNNISSRMKLKVNQNFIKRSKTKIRNKKNKDRV